MEEPLLPTRVLDVSKAVPHPIMSANQRGKYVLQAIVGAEFSL